MNEQNTNSKDWSSIFYRNICKNIILELTYHFFFQLLTCLKRFDPFDEILNTPMLCHETERRGNMLVLVLEAGCGDNSGNTDGHPLCPYTRKAELRDGLAPEEINNLT